MVGSGVRGLSLSWWLGEHRELAQAREIVSGQHGHDAGEIARGFKVRGEDSGVSVGASKHSQVEHVGECHVSHVGPLPAQEPRVLGAATCSARVTLGLIHCG